MPKRSQPVLTLTAAAKRINMGDPTSAKRDAAKSKPWHAEAWGYFDEVPEIKESIRYRGNQLGKVRLFVAVANPKDPTADPVPVTDPDSGVPPSVATAATEELARLRSRMGGQAEIMRMLDMNLEVVGEAYLIGYSERVEETIDPVTNLPRTEVTQAEDWMIRSVSEVEVKGSGPSAKYLVKSDPSDTKGVELDKERDTIMRIWLRHPQWASQADCAMRGLLGECRILQVLCQQQLAHAYRALSAGILTVPNELMPKGPADPTQPDEETEDPLMDKLYEVLSAPIEDPTHPSTVQPGLLRGEAAHLHPDALRLISFYDAAQVADIEARIEARIGRIARGLNLPVEKIMGHQSTTYANASQVDEDEFNDYLAPSAETAVEALTFAFLTPQLEEAGGETAAWADRLFVWYDPSDLIAQPDAEKHALEAHQANTISDAALRKSFGFGDEDKPEPLELLQRAGLRRGILTADLTLALLNLLGIPIEVEDSAEVEDPNAEAVAMLAQMMAGARPRPIRAASRPSSPDYGRRLTEIDRELRTRLLTAANVAMGQALDRAANRLRTKTNGTAMRASLQNVPRRSWFAQLGPSLVAEAMGEEDPLEGAWDGLEGDFRAWGSDAQSRARMTAGQAVGGDLSGLEPQQADDLDGAWLWFAAALTTLAVAKLWTPDPSAPTIGEHDPSVMIPAGMVRQALARAGGAQGLITGGQDAWVTLTDAGTRPAGGIGTGDLIRGALRDGGATIEGYVWRYGPAFRAKPFDPHMRLDNVPFVNFDDDVLASEGEFGFATYLPGDHGGCRCDCEPAIIGVDER